MSTLYLSALPLWLAVLLIVILPTAIAMAGPALLHRWIGHQNLASNNEIAGFKFATVGVIYAVLLAFAVIVVWEKFSLAEFTVVNEAGAAATIYRLVPDPDPDMTATRAAVTKYLRSAIDNDWPRMAEESESTDTTKALNQLYSAALGVAREQAQHPATSSELFSQIDAITLARRTRLHLAAGVVPPIIWFVLYGGAVLTICFTFFFGTKNVRAQMLMTGMLSVLVFMGLLVIVSIDHPFTGPTSVDSEPLQKVLKDFAP